MFERRRGKGNIGKPVGAPECKTKFGLPSVGSIAGIGDLKSHSACVAAIDESSDEARLKRNVHLRARGVRAALISRRKTRRTNSETLNFSLRALPARISRASRGRRNVTETLPLSSFVLGMKPCVLLYHT